MLPLRLHSSGYGRVLGLVVALSLGTLVSSLSPSLINGTTHKNVRSPPKGKNFRIYLDVTDSLTVD